MGNITKYHYMFHTPGMTAHFMQSDFSLENRSQKVMTFHHSPTLFYLDMLNAVFGYT